MADKEYIPIERMRRRKKETPKPPAPPSPVTAEQLRAMLTSLPPPQVSVQAPDVNVPTPIVNVDLQALLDVSRETLDMLAALVDARTGRLSIKVTERDDDGNIAGVDVTIQDAH